MSGNFKALQYPVPFPIRRSQLFLQMCGVAIPNFLKSVAEELICAYQLEFYSALAPSLVISILQESFT